jgi:hypothetical protein
VIVEDKCKFVLSYQKHRNGTPANQFVNKITFNWTFQRETNRQTKQHCGFLSVKRNNMLHLAWKKGAELNQKDSPLLSCPVSNKQCRLVEQLKK